MTISNIVKTSWIMLEKYTLKKYLIYPNIPMSIYDHRKSFAKVRTKQLFTVFFYKVIIVVNHSLDL